MGLHQLMLVVNVPVFTSCVVFLGSLYVSCLVACTSLKKHNIYVDYFVADIWADNFRCKTYVVTISINL